MIVDDYGAVPACARAVDDYRAANAIEEPLKRIDWTGVYGGGQMKADRNLAS